MGSSRVVRYLEHTPVNAFLFYDCPQSCGADFSGPCGVAQSARVGAGGLLVHGGIPEKGKLRLCASKATRSRLGFGQHRPRGLSGGGKGQKTAYENWRGGAGGGARLLYS